MPKIKSLKAHKIINSRGSWTIETHVMLDDGSEGIQAIPEGASKGENECVYVPALKAIEVIEHPLNDLLMGQESLNLQNIDEMMLKMDGTSNKSHLGGNSILSVSLAIAKANAISLKLELYEYLRLIYDDKKYGFTLPTPVFNILNGGKHADNNLSFQEFMIIPNENLSYREKLEVGVDCYNILKDYLDINDYSTAIGDEGGFAPAGLNPVLAFEHIYMALKDIYKFGHDIYFGSDIAAESFYDNGIYTIKEQNLKLNGKQLIEYYKSLLEDFNIKYLEDPFYEKDYNSWQTFNSIAETNDLLVVADDLVVTNPKFLQIAIDNNLANSVIVKPNQVGSLSETFNFIKLAQKNNMKIIISHRSGDTAEDTFISDLSVAVGAEYIKSGAPARGERVAKYNRLLEINRKL